MNSIKKICWFLSFIVTLLITIQVALSANSLNFQVSLPAGQEKIICPCEYAQYEIQLNNIGNNFELFYVSTGGDDDYLTLSSQKLNLAPFDKKSIYVFSNAPCQVYGERDFKVTIKAKSSGYSATIPFKLKINPCYNYSLSGQGSLSVCESESKNFTYTLTNLKHPSNIYSIKLSDSPKFVSSNLTRVGLPGFGNISFDLMVKPLAGDANKYNFNVTVLSEYGKIIEELPINLSVKKCVDVNVTIPKREILCADDTKDVFISLTNTGLKPEYYSILFSNYSFIDKISYDVYYIEPNETSNIRVRLNPANINTTKDYKVLFNVTVKDSQFVKQDYFNVSLVSSFDCYKPMVLDYKISNNRTKQIYAVRVKNVGAKYSIYSIDTNTKYGFIRSIEPRISVSPEEVSEFHIVLDPNNATEFKKYYIDLLLNSNSITYHNQMSFNVYNENSFLRKYWAYCLVAVILIILIMMSLVLLIRRLRKKKRVYPEQENLAEPEPKIYPSLTPKYVFDNRSNFWKGAFFGLIFIILFVSIFYLIISNVDSSALNSSKNITGNKLALNSSGLIDITGNKVFVSDNATTKNINQTSSVFSVAIDFIKQYYKYVIVGFLLLVLIIIVLETSSRKKSEESEEKKVVVDNTPKSTLKKTRKNKKRK